MSDKTQPPKPELIEIPAKTRHEILNIPKQRLRVCAYCRVSTDTEEQESSYESQLQFYTSYISKNENWLFAGIYADKGISGKSVRNRPQFLQMVKDCEAGKIDMIITKSLSRFARNTQNSIFYIRLLRDMGIPIYFEQQCLNSMDHNVDLILTILSSIAEEESRSMSQNIKSAYRHRAALGINCNPRPCYGYRIDKNGSYEVVAKEAHIVMRIFNEFEKGAAISAICNRLQFDGILSPTGSIKWHRNTISNMLSNEKYIGDCLLQKTYSPDFLSPRKKNNGEATQWLLKGNHTPIITKQQFDHVQELLKAEKMPRQNKVSFVYPLSTLITCQWCGRNYNRNGRTTTGKKDIKWSCFGRCKLHNCKNRNLFEAEVFNAYRKLFPHQQARYIRNNVSQIFVDGNMLTFITTEDTKLEIKLPHRGYNKK